MRRRLLHPLDKYVLTEFTKIFVSTAIGFPILVTIFDLTDSLDKYLMRNLPRGDIALSYLYWIPFSMYMVLPAAVLFAAVFTIGGLTRHSEITAAKASGISFHRVAAMIFVGSLGAAGLTWVMSELAPIGLKRRNELLQETHATGSERYNFAFASDGGRVYKVSQLRSAMGTADGLQIERKGKEGDESYPTWLVTSTTARWVPQRGWVLLDGMMHVIPNNTRDVAVAFDSLRDRRLTETPVQLLASSKAPEDMGYEELGRYVAALERSGSDVNELKVERALKIAVPVTCIIIALFGAPLATSTQRGGAAWGIGLSLGVTIVFLVAIQLTKAVGAKGLMPPEWAAWTPNMIFGVAGLILLWRVRT